MVDKFEPFDYKGSIQFARIEVTQNYNLSCRHCYECSSKIVQKLEMTLESFKLAIDSLISIGVNRIQLVGGEPLLHSKIEEMIEYVAGEFEFIEIFTNGTLLTERLLKLVTKNGILLTFSVYSEFPFIHDYATVTDGSFWLTFKNI